MAVSFRESLAEAVKAGIIKDADDQRAQIEKIKEDKLKIVDDVVSKLDDTEFQEKFNVLLLNAGSGLVGLFNQIKQEMKPAPAPTVQNPN